MILAQHDVREAVAVEIDEPQARVRPVDVRQGGKRPKRSPVVHMRAMVKTAAHRAAEAHEVGQSVARHVEQLLNAGVASERRGTTEPRDRGLRAQGARRSELSLSEVTLVVEGSALVGKDTRDPFAIEIDPLVGATVDTVGDLREALAVEIADGRLKRGAAVVEVDPRK